MTDFVRDSATQQRTFLYLGSFENRRLLLWWGNLPGDPWESSEIRQSRLRFQKNVSAVL